MSEGGEARNHEGDEAEAVVRAFLGEERWATMTTERREQECERMHAALDAVRCAQGRDTDAALAQVQSAQARAARSPQGEDHEAGMWVTLELLCDGVPACGSEQALSILEAAGHEVDRERVKVRLPRRVSSVIDERLGELLDGETT